MPITLGFHLSFDNVESRLYCETRLGKYFSHFAHGSNTDIPSIDNFFFIYWDIVFSPQIRTQFLNYVIFSTCDSKTYCVSLKKSQDCNKVDSY